MLGETFFDSLYPIMIFLNWLHFVNVYLCLFPIDYIIFCYYQVIQGCLYYLIENRQEGEIEKKLLEIIS